MSKEEFYGMLKKLNFSPKIIVDCGAAYGEWSAMIKSVYSDSLILGIDANDWSKGQIRGADITEIQVLSNEDDKECIFFRKKENLENATFCTGDSLFKENSQHYQPHNTIECLVKTVTLNTLLTKHKIDNVDLLKLDTQGSEILIMEGLKEKLKNVSFIEVECSTYDYNQGGCKFIDVLEFLKQNFDLFDILHHHRSNLSSVNVNEIPKEGDFLYQLDVVFKNKKYNFQ